MGAFQSHQLAQAQEKVKELEAVWKKQADDFTALAKQTLAPRAKKQGGEGKQD
jgi:hypothetical protein